MPEKKTRKRFTQAVVIIHGIGEQHPMETVRGFVDAVLPDAPDGGEKFFTKPDPMSESFELRKLQNRSQPRTHFFEYYWAYKVEGTKLNHITSWLSLLLFRSPSRVPSQMRPLWFVSWLLILLVALGLAFNFIPSNLTQAIPLPGSVSFMTPILSALLFSIYHMVVFDYVGDAARYLSTSPGNIKLRQAIRADGMRLVRKLHESGEYDRILIVGHSLGSVVAYDIIRNLWQEYYETYLTPKKSAQPALENLERIGEDLRASRNGATVEDYMKAQVELWKEMRSLGNPWLITDLITAGSPLTHAAILLASDRGDLRARQRQRELPTNPPQAEVTRTKKGGESRHYSYAVWTKYGKRNNITLKAVHYGGPFAFTRWTNLYYPAALGLFGDIVGGPIAQVFGPGVKDVAVGAKKFLIRATLLAHISYWDKNAGMPKNKKLVESLPELIKALDLENKEYFS